MVFFLQTRSYIRRWFFLLTTKARPQIRVVKVLALVLLLASCESSLDVDAPRKTIPLDPPDTAGKRIVPDSLSLHLYLKTTGSSSRTELFPITRTTDIRIDTSVVPHLLWADVRCTLSDSIKTLSPLVNNEHYLLSSLRFRVDSAQSDRLYQFRSTPEEGSGTALQLQHVSADGIPLDSILIIPPLQPIDAQSYSILSLSAFASAGRREITGTYTFAALLYDTASGQYINIPIEGILSVYYH